MKPRERVEHCLRGGKCTTVPFTIYESKFPTGAEGDALRQRGTCQAFRKTPGFKQCMPNVKETVETIEKPDGTVETTTHYETPVGTVSMVMVRNEYAPKIISKMFKTPDDFKVLEFILRDTQVEADYEPIFNALKNQDDYTVLRGAFGLEPLQTLISASFIDMTDFCYQWMENRDEMLKLYDAVVEIRRKTYPIVAQSPLLHANYGGNVVAEIIGPEVFRDYYLPHYHEAAEVMHKHGKLIGCHYDANCRLLAPLIAETELDYIEAFTPAPDTDMTLKEARSAWPDKVLWINYPSSVHLQDDAAVEQKTVDLLNELNKLDGFIMGITEDVPPHRVPYSYNAILNGLERHAREYPEMYK
jgi:hypothetical protein